MNVFSRTFNRHSRLSVAELCQALRKDQQSVRKALARLGVTPDATDSVPALTAIAMRECIAGQLPADSLGRWRGALVTK